MIRSLRIKRVMRYDPAQRKLRLFRIMWEGGPYWPTVGSYSVKLAVSLTARFPFIRVSARKSYGGIFV